MHCAAIGIAETEAAVAISMHPKSAFMHQPVVPAAQQNEVIQVGFTTIRPVLNMMRIDKPPAGAAGQSGVGPAYHSEIIDKNSFFIAILLLRQSVYPLKTRL